MQADAPGEIPAPMSSPERRTVRSPAARRRARARAGGGPSLLAPGAAHDPYRLYRVLREEYPLSYDAPLGAWLVSRYDDVATALTDPRFAGFPHDGAPRGGPAPLGLCHGNARCLPRDRYAVETGRVPPHLAERVERTAFVLARRLAGRPQADLVEEFCRWLPAGSGTGAGTRTAADGPCTRHTGLRETALASFLANLLDDADLMAALRIEPALAGRAWTESLRRDPPVQIVLRRTRTEVTLSGGTLPARAPVACLIGSAGRDPERFAAPDVFDPFRRDQDRDTPGPAGCPAVALGRLEAEQGLRALLDAMPALRWADGFRPAATGLLTRGPRSLLVRPG
ncbi:MULTISPECIES: cytochrome P450 [unclassified Streptomyces]|uniref:cytochrome P450 n=1 Tax=unclassified Streptomyces TaxID=2593676 RepID=UPI002553107B|nr:MULTISPECIES: cytochrome P450 [unclassified Streptomyces]WRZ68107.1 cytochrome P450 [Streptomyces sp. NBC_01257]WSU62053.1 cytochrome P450 [Streptomyces sp. NBC_01104]